MKIILLVIFFGSFSPSFETYRTVKTCQAYKAYLATQDVKSSDCLLVTPSEAK